MGHINIDVKRRFMGRFKYDNDLLQEITNFITNENIRSGEIRIIGAVKKARFGYFNQSTREYKFIEKNEHMEILSAIGNISLKSGKPFPHVHIILADENGNAFGGHLMEGTKIFAAEFVIVDYGENNLERVDDDYTGLTLWNL
ncbi:MAG: DNA-binding protein [Thermoanaerobacterium sp.]|nr:DNA-binding protein [Thermoanaerobacterium sp.]